MTHIKHKLVVTGAGKEDRGLFESILVYLYYICYAGPRKWLLNPNKIYLQQIKSFIQLWA